MSNHKTRPAKRAAKPALPAAPELRAELASEAVSHTETAIALVADLPETVTPDIKEPVMDTNTINETTAAATDMGADMQARAKAAFDKGSELTADLTAFHKGNFDAMVEAGQVLAAGMQDLGRTVVEDAKSAAETVSADVKAMAAVKSPTELFQLQGKIMRRNLDTMVAKTSQNAEVMMKLANDMFMPLQGRASVAMERFSKAA